MTDSKTLNSVIDGYYDAIYSNKFSARRKLAEEHGLDDVFAASFFINRAVFRDPQPIPIDNMVDRMAYFTVDRMRKSLETLAEKGYLTPEFTIADKGKAFHKTGHEVFEAEVKVMDALSDEEMNRIIVLLKKVVDKAASLDAPFHPELDLFLNYKVDETESLQKQVLGWVGYLDWYRDDSHVAAWVPTGLAGHEFDALTYMWKDGIDSAEALSERFSKGRGFSFEDYAAAIGVLVERGWAEASDDEGKFKLTESGKAKREEVEAQTDDNFEIPKSALSDAEFEELGKLLRALGDLVKAEKDS